MTEVEMDLKRVLRFAAVRRQLPFTGGLHHGVAAEFGVIMLLYLKHALRDRLAAGAEASREVVDDAVREGAVQRVRPKAMTVAVILAGLVPIVWGSGTGSEVMSRIAAPMLGGMVTAPLLSLFVVPAAYAPLRRPRRQRA
jgi:Cu(I)/Ag(I) efflux system membrane protein CusA/SilA